jgi:precorrin-6B methylase 2
LKPGTLRGVQIKFVAKGSDSGEPNAQGWVDPKEPHVLYLALDNTSGAAVTDAAPGQPVGVYSRGGKQRTPAEEAGATTAHETDHVFSDLGHTRAAELSAMLREEKLFPTGRSVADIKRRIDRLYGELPTGDPHWWADGHAAKPANAQDDTDGVTIELTADAPDEGRQQSRMDDAGPGASHEPISPDELHAAIRSEGPALIDQSEIPFVALAGPGNGRILDIGAGSGGKALTMAGLDVRNKVHALEPYQILGEAGADEVARVDPITAQRIEFDARSAQQLVKDGMAGQYSRVNIMAPDPRLIGRANEPYQNFDAMVDSAMQLVAPGGKIALHTESDFAYTCLLQKVQQKGWMVIELKGARAVKEYIPDSHSRYAGDDKVFGGPDYYRYGLIAVRPQ